VVPIHPRLLAALGDVPPTERVGYVVGLSGGRPMDEVTLSKMFEAKGWLRAEYGLVISAHMLRRAFALLLLHSNADLATIQQLLGHRSIATTSLYLSAPSDHTHQAVAALPDRVAAAGPATAAPAERIILCAVCGVEVVAKRSTRMYCSIHCRDAKRRSPAPERAPASCEECGAPITQNRRGARRRFCEAHQDRRKRERS
jgi:endogenous inhibitor of DNA gyrase (YacG/DUF329 family)